VVAVAQGAAEHPVLAALVVAVMVVISQRLQQMPQPIQVAEVAVVATLQINPQMAVLALLLFVTQIPTLLHRQLRVLLQLQQLADSEFIDGLVQVQLLSKVTHGAFCTT
jgi:hypothetical protein